MLSSQSKLLGIGYSLLQSALDAWAVAAGHDSKFWEASDVFLMIANCQAIKREQSLRKDARYPESKFRILRKLADGKEVLAFRVVPTAARQFTNPTINQYYNGNSIKLHRAVVQSQSSHSPPQQQPAKRPKHGVPEEPWSWLPAWRSGWHYGWHSKWETGWQDGQHSRETSSSTDASPRSDAARRQITPHLRKCDAELAGQCVAAASLADIGRAGSSDARDWRLARRSAFRSC